LIVFGARSAETCSWSRDLAKASALGWRLTGVGASRWISSKLRTKKKMKHKKDPTISSEEDSAPVTQAELQAAVGLLTEHQKLLELEIAKLTNTLKNVGISPVQ
jgi:hypothetical protein